jgi:4-amino-4-deoxy-L-arabinose transferase-like glycosyltransferase
MNEEPETIETSAKLRHLKWVVIGLFFLWLTVSLASYYIVQNAYLKVTLDIFPNIDRWLPFSVSLGAIGRALLDLLVALWIAFAAFGTGRWSLGRIGRSRFTPIEELLFGLGFGFGILGMIVLLLGLAGTISQPVLLLIMVFLTLASGRSSINFIRTLPRPRPGRLILLFLLISLLLALSLALLPPTSWDGLFYHLTGPKLYLDQGRIAPGIDIPHLNFPSLFEMLYLLALGLRGEVAAVLLHFIFVLMLMGLVYVAADKLLGVRNAWSAVIFLLAIPLVLSLAGWAYNDLALAFYEVAALYGLLKWRLGWGGQKETKQPAKSGEVPSEGAPASNLRSSVWLIMSGIMLGLAMGLKYTSVVALISLAGLILWWYRKQLRRALQPLLLFLGLAVLVSSPWLIKNLFFTGNPVYPFLFEGANWDEFRSAAYGEGGTGIAYDPASCTEYSTEFLVGQHATGCDLDVAYLGTRLLLLPYDITLGIRDASQDGPIGPLFLIFLPLLLIYGVFSKRSKRPAALGGLLFFALTQFIFWTIGVIGSAALWQSRLLLPALIALCPALSWLLEDLAHLDHPRFSLQRLLYLVIGSVLLVGLFIQAINLLPQQPWGYIIGDESKDENLRRRLGSHYEAMKYINTETPEDAGIAFLWEPRSYYCQRDCRPDSILDAFGRLQYEYGDAPDVVHALRDDGITHILIFEKGLDLVLEVNSGAGDLLEEPRLLKDLRENYLDPVTTIGQDWYTLYRIKDGL